MKNRTILAALVVSLTATVFAQDGEIPRTAWGTPDFNGVWARPYTPDISRGMEGGLPYTDWGRENFENYNAEEGDYTGSCLPFGHMRSMNGPDPIQIMQTPDHLAFLYEQNSWFKVMPIEGDSILPKVPSWYGESKAHWEGDTLVVVTNNFNGKTRLDTTGHPHSDQLTLTERFTLLNDSEARYEVTVDDPKTYTEPFTQTRTFTLRPDWDIQEYSCNENNKGLIEGRIKVPTYDEQ